MAAMSAEFTFDQIESSADRTFAYALLVRTAKPYLLLVYRLKVVTWALDRLLRVLSPNHLEALTVEQTGWLKTRLQELHRALVMFSRSPEAEAATKLPLLRTLVRKCQDQTEDLYDIVEDLVLVSSQDFKNLVSDCATSIGLSLGDTVAGMQDQRNS
jgi:hypothetical protein